MGIDIELQTISRGYDRKTCWVHPRPGLIPRGPGKPPIVVVTLQQSRISGDDVFYPISEFRTDDGGRTWNGPVTHTDTLGRHRLADGVEEAVCDWWPAWHARSGVLLGIGHTVRYEQDNIPNRANPRSTAYSVYHPQTQTWAPWRKLDTACPDTFLNEGAGSTQRVDLSNGDILLPTYFVLPACFQAARENTVKSHAGYLQMAATVMRCTFDGINLRTVEHGDELTVPTERGFCEPSLTAFGGRFFLTLRHNNFGAVVVGEDGLHFSQPRPWTWDDGTDLGTHNTQQHWVTMPDALYLVYTRRGAGNDHIPRNRAPLFIAQVDTERLCVLRATERVLVPERGAKLGNFGVVRISDTESWVTASEWMQTLPPNYWDVAVCEKRGSDNSVFVAKIRAAR